MPMSHSADLTHTLEAIEASTDNEKISFNDIVQALNHRGFGSLLIGPSLIVVLPTGAIPGIPALCGLLLAVITIQLVLGRKYPWLPQILRNVSFDREKYTNALAKAKPYTERIDSFFHPRFEFLTSKPAQRILGFISFLLSLAMIAIGFIPFLPLVLAAPILMFGLALSVKDGLLAAIGLLLMGAGITALPFLLGSQELFSF